MRSVSWEFSRLCSFLQVALRSSWDFWGNLCKSQFRRCFGSFSTALYRMEQILLLTVRDHWTPCPPPFLGNSFKRSLILLTNQAISFAKQLQGPCKSRRTAPLLKSAFWWHKGIIKVMELQTGQPHFLDCSGWLPSPSQLKFQTPSLRIMQGSSPVRTRCTATILSSKNYSWLCFEIWTRVNFSPPSPGLFPLLFHVPICIDCHR